MPVNDRANYFGDGIYEVAYCRNYKIYSLYEHMERLYESARALDIGIPIDKPAFSELIYSLSAKLDSPNQLIYWQVSRGTEMRSHAPSDSLSANIHVTIKPAEIRDTYAPMKLIRLEDTRYLHCNMKTLICFPRCLRLPKQSAAVPTRQSSTEAAG